MAESRGVMGQDDEFSESEKQTIVNREKQEQDDFNNSMSDRETGRQRWFGYERNSTQNKSRKEREKHSLQQALALSAAYAKLYQQTMQNLNEAENAVYEAQVKAAETVNEAQNALDQTIEKASTTVDGTAVFRSADGSVYTYDGRLLEGDELDGITWREDEPSWEEYQKQLDDLREKQDYLDRMISHEQRLAELRTEMEDEDNPPTEERLKEIQKDIEEIHNDAAPLQTKDYEISKIKYDTSEGLDFNF